MSAVLQFAPNVIFTDLLTSQGNAGWSFIGTDGNAYTTLASLPVGVKPWPGIDAPCWLQYFTIRSASSTGLADGGPFAYAYNRWTAPLETTNARLISGAGQTVAQPGPVYIVWVKKTVSGDIIQLQGGW